MKLAAILLCGVALAAGGCRKTAPAADGGRAAPVAAGRDGGGAASAVPDGGGGPVALGDPDELVVDPYCGMRLKKGEAAATAVYQGVTYYFCLADHRDAFLADPHKALCRLAGADAGPDCDAR